MSQELKLIELKAENFKRLKAVRITPTGAVTPITGKNGAGKSSVLDAIAAALGGSGQIPDMPMRAGTTKAEVVLDLDGIVVRRNWNASGTSLTVTAKDGSKLASPQRVLDQLINSVCFDPLSFSRMSPKEQSATLARIAGVDLAAYATKRQAVYDQRTAANRAAKDQKTRLSSMPEHADAPDEPISVQELVGKLTEAEQVNGQRERLKSSIREAEKARDETSSGITQRSARIQALEAELEAAKADLTKWRNHFDKTVVALEEAKKAFDAAPFIDTAPIHDQMRSAESVNERVRAKKARQALAAEVRKSEDFAANLDRQVETIDEEHRQAIARANLPVPGLSFTSDGVMLNGVPFNQASTAEQLRTSVAVGMSLNPKLRLMLIRDGSLLDAESMGVLAEMATQFGGQVLIERVAGHGETGVLIEDGEVAQTAAAA